MKTKNSCYKCQFWDKTKGVSIPDGQGKCKRPGGHCDPDVVKGSQYVGAIFRKRGDGCQHNSE